MELRLPKNLTEGNLPGTSGTTSAEKPDDAVEVMLIAWFAFCRAGIESARKFIEEQGNKE